jgi:hypothetical protein
MSANDPAVGNLGSRSGRGDASDLEVAATGGARFTDRLQQLEDARAAADRAKNEAKAEQEALGFARGTKAANDLADERAAAARKALDDAKVNAAKLISEANAEVQRRTDRMSAAEKESADRATAKMKEADEYAARKRQEADSDRSALVQEHKLAANRADDLDRREAALKQREQEVGALERRAHEILADYKALAEKYIDPHPIGD